MAHFWPEVRRIGILTLPVEIVGNRDVLVEFTLAPEHGDGCIISPGGVQVGFYTQRGSQGIAGVIPSPLLPLNMIFFPACICSSIRVHS